MREGGNWFSWGCPQGGMLPVSKFPGMYFISEKQEMKVIIIVNKNKISNRKIETLKWNNKGERRKADLTKNAHKVVLVALGV